MSGLEVFTDAAGHQLRSVTIDGEPWFVAKDVTDALGLGRAQDSIRYLDDDERGVCLVGTPSGEQQMATVSEAGLYSLILRSRRPEAKVFKRWVTHEVLPAIRRAGSYSATARFDDLIPKSLPEALVAYAHEIKAREAAVAYAKELEPKADAYTAFLEADGTYSVGAVAKMLGLSQNKLFDRLRSSGVLIGKGHMRNTPYQQYMHHFRVTAHTFDRSNGTNGTSYTTTVQPSGVEFIRRKLNLPQPSVPTVQAVSS